MENLRIPYEGNRLRRYEGTFVTFSLYVYSYHRMYLRTFVDEFGFVWAFRADGASVQILRHTCGLVSYLYEGSLPSSISVPVNKMFRLVTMNDPF